MCPWNVIHDMWVRKCLLINGFILGFSVYSAHERLFVLAEGASEKSLVRSCKACENSYRVLSGERVLSSVWPSRHKWKQNPETSSRKRVFFRARLPEEFEKKSRDRRRREREKIGHLSLVCTGCVISPQPTCATEKIDDLFRRIRCFSMWYLEAYIATDRREVSRWRSRLSPAVARGVQKCFPCVLDSRICPKHWQHSMRSCTILLTFDLLAKKVYLFRDYFDTRSLFSVNPAKSR